MRWRRQRRRCAHRRPFWHLQRAPLPPGPLRGPAVLQRRHALDLPRERARGELGACLTISANCSGRTAHCVGAPAGIPIIAAAREARHLHLARLAAAHRAQRRHAGARSRTRSREIAREIARDHSMQATRVALRRRSSVGRHSSSLRWLMAHSARPPPASCSRRSDHPTGESVSCT